MKFCDEEEVDALLRKNRILSKDASESLAVSSSLNWTPATWTILSLHHDYTGYA
jgi:hypothetical protein